MIADLGAVVVDALHAHLPAALDWDVHSFDAPEHVTQLDTWDAPDLVVVVCAHADTQPCVYLKGLLAHAKLYWPHTSFVFASPHPLPQMEMLFSQFGVMPVADTTNSTAMVRMIVREMEQHSTGSVQGVSLPSFLQMLEWDQKSVAVRVSSKDHWGRLHFRQGRLVDAYAFPSGEVGESAALEIIEWEGPELSLERSYHNAATVIQRSLTALLLEAMKRKDEAPQAQPTRPPASQRTDDLEETPMFRRPKQRTSQGDTPGVTSPSLQPAATLPSTNPVLVSSAPTPSSAPSWAYQETFMANVKDTLQAAMQEIDGLMAAALVDYSSGMALGTIGSGLDLEVAAAGNSDVVRAKMKTMEMLGIQGQIEDILITLQTQYHIIYIVPNQSLFLYLVLAKDKTNLAMSRYKIKALAKDISIS